MTEPKLHLPTCTMISENVVVDPKNSIIYFCVADASDDTDLYKFNFVNSNTNTIQNRHIVWSMFTYELNDLNKRVKTIIREYHDHNQ